jgi:hypothetical protein
LNENFGCVAIEIVHKKLLDVYIGTKDFSGWHFKANQCIISGWIFEETILLEIEKMLFPVYLGCSNKKCYIDTNIFENLGLAINGGNVKQKLLIHCPVQCHG